MVYTSLARALFLAALVAPVHNFCTAPRTLAVSVARRPVLRVPAVVAATEETEAAYRTLGLDGDASYDQIMDTYMALQETYGEDPVRLGALEKAKETVLDDRLRQRMTGTLSASYEGQLSIDDRPPEKRTPIFEIVRDFSKKVITPPKPKYALNVVALLGGLTLATWVAPSTAGTILLINVMSGMGFVYNRGEPEVARDDFGQVGEIRPMKPKPFALTVAITTAIWIAGWWKSKQMIAAMVNPPRSLQPVLRTTLISLGLIIPSLFVRVHALFD